MIAHTDFALSDAEAVLAQFAGVPAPWPGGRWTWDMRFNCAVSVISISDWPAIEAWLQRTLAFRFESGEASHLSARQRSSVVRFGGVRSGQLGFSDPDRGVPQRYALVWPWSDGLHISVRLAVG